MVFAFDRPDLDVADNVRRAARVEFDQAVAEIGETGFEIHDTVRNVRRRLKRVRALLRLVRPVSPQFKTENESLREIGAEVAALRDAKALVEAIDWLGRRVDAHLAAEVIIWRALLVSRAADLETAIDRESMLLDLRAKLRDARVRSELWELRNSGGKAIVPGLTNTYRRARRAYRAAAAAREDDLLFHDWRKEVKHHWCHLKLLRGLMPAFAERRRRQMGDLAELLGGLQNLCVLRDHLHTAPSRSALLDAAIDRHLRRLRRKALRVGKGLFAAKPKVVRRRWQTYVEDWITAYGR